MSFHPLMMKLVSTLLDSLPHSPKVVELGNQTFDPTMFGAITEQKDKMLPLVVRYLDSKGVAYDKGKLVSLMGMSEQEAKPHTETFYKALGFSEYRAIDVNSNYGSLIMDLNANLKDKYGYEETFDLVTNNGTGEHVFNQLAVFENMHNLATPKGVMLFVLPFHNWINHGFFNFNPLLFTDLAQANGYKILRLSVAGNLGHEIAANGAGADADGIRFAWEPDAPLLSIEEFQQRGALWPVTLRTITVSLVKSLLGRSPFSQGSRFPQAIGSLAGRTPNISIVAALQKLRDEPFQMPMQGMYSGDNLEGDSLSAEYSRR